MRILQYAVRNIIRNTFLSLSSIITLALIVFFIHVLLFLQYTSEYVIASVNERITISVNLRSGFVGTNSQVIELVGEIQRLPEVEVELIGPEQAWKILESRDPELAHLVEGDKNPLPASIRVRNIPLNAYADLDAIIIRYQNIVVYDSSRSKQSLVDYTAQYGKIESLTHVLRSIEWGILAVIIFFIFSVFVIIYAIIGNFVFYYRDEIRITQLVGGDRIFVYGPFSIQWLLYTMSAWVISLGFFIVLIESIHFSIMTNFSEFVGVFLSQYTGIFVLELVVLAVVGAASGFVSSYRFVRDAQK